MTLMLARNPKFHNYLAIFISLLLFYLLLVFFFPQSAVLITDKIPGCAQWLFENPLILR